MPFTFIRSYLKSHKLQVFLVTNIKNIFYLTGFRGSFARLLITSKNIYFFTDGRYLPRAKKEVLDKKISIRNIPDMKCVLNKYTCVGFEGDDVSINKLKKWKKSFPATRWKPLSEMVEELRAQKTGNEIKYIKKAAKICFRVFEDIKKKLKPGVKEKDIAFEIEVLIRKYGGEDISFDPIVAFGENSAVPHHESSDRKYKLSDVALFDFGSKFHGYCSDMTRMILPKKATKLIDEVYKIVLEAKKRATKAVKAGMKVKDLDAVAREYIKEKGYDDKFVHSLGHGVGIKIHEKPHLSFRSEEVLKKGNVITIEPGIYIPGKFGVRVEDMVVV